MVRQIAFLLVVLLVFTVASCERTPSSQAYYRVMAMLKNGEYNQALVEVNRRLEKDPRKISNLEDKLILLMANENPRVRDEIIHTQKQLDAIGAGRRLLIEQSKSRLVQVRQHSAYVIGCLHEAKGLGALKDLAEDINEEVRAEAIHALGKLHHPSAKNLLLVRLRDGFWKVRAEAAGALGKIGDPTATKQLFRAVDDPDDYVKMQIFDSLLTLAHPSQTSVYLKEINSDNLAKKTAAALALGKIQYHEAAPLLLSLLKDRNTPQRKQIVGCLKTLGGDSLKAGFTEQSGRERDPQVKELLLDYLRQQKEAAKK